MITKADILKWIEPSLDEGNSRCSATRNVKNSVDCHFLADSSGCKNIYSGSDLINCKDSSYLSHSSDSEDSHRSSYLKNCKHMFACFNMQNAEYCIMNVQLSKREYIENVKLLIEEFGDKDIHENFLSKK